MRLSKAEIADLLGCSLPTVDAKVRRGMPFTQRGGQGKKWIFESADVIAWERDQAVTNAIGDESTADEEELKRRKLAAETSMAELSLAKERREVAPLEEIEKGVSKAFAEVRARMRNVPGRAVPMLIGETDETRFKSVLLAEIDQALETLAESGLCEEEEIIESADEAA